MGSIASDGPTLITHGAWNLVRAFEYFNASSSVVYALPSAVGAFPSLFVSEPVPPFVVDAPPSRYYHHHVVRSCRHHDEFTQVLSFVMSGEV